MSGLRRIVAMVAITGATALTVAREAPIDLLTISEKSGRYAALVGELKSAQVGKVREWLARIDAAPACAARDDDRLLVTEFLSFHDRETAWSYLNAVDATTVHRDALAEAYLRGWTRWNAEEAWAWCVSQSQREYLDPAKAVLETVAETNPTQALPWLKAELAAHEGGEDPTSLRLERAFAFFRRLSNTGDYAQCRNLLDALPSGETRNQLIFYTTDRMASFVLEDSMRWAEERADQSDAFYSFAAVAVQKSRRDLAAALRWVLTIKNPETRSRTLKMTAADAVEHNSSKETVEAILRVLPTAADRQAAYAAFATGAELVQSAPAQFMDWAAEIEAPMDRRVALLRGYAAWFEMDAKAAEAHLGAQQKITPEERKIVRHFVQVEEEP